MQAGGVFNFLIMIILLVNSYRTYILLYDTVRNYETVGSLQKLAMRDALTELGNRNSLLIELDRRLHEDTAFFLLFMGSLTALKRLMIPMAIFRVISI